MSPCENFQSDKQSVLGKHVNYTKKIDASLLHPISRKPKRDEINVTYPLPFVGFDLWHAYEFSWLNLKGKPQVAVLEFKIPSSSEYIIESKSFKLYLFSFSSSKFASFNEIKSIIIKDISKACGTEISLNKIDLDNSKSYVFKTLAGKSIDMQDITCDEYAKVSPEFLNIDIKEKSTIVTETLHSNLLKSNCLVTNQPDWGSVEITYTGNKIDEAGLLKYIVSFREHNEFHEQCIERIFNDILQVCKPKKLYVAGFYTRRGGLDINPIRAMSNEILLEGNKDKKEHTRLFRQ